MMNKIITGLVWVAVGIAMIWGAGAIVIKNRNKVDIASSSLDNFAKCLTDRGVKEYGAYWCPHCQKQKKAFGGSFEFIDYVECADPNSNNQKQVCTDAGIKGYPTWVFPSGERIEGEASFQDLAEKSGCEYKK